jgi:hypothetical protein
MGQITPNMGIYIPAAGETNYDASFAAGMVNIDQHDHSGGPNKGVPIATSGIADGSITYPKLNANVADNTTGLLTHTGGLANQLYLAPIFSNLFGLSAGAGVLAHNGTTVFDRTLTGTTNQIAVTNGNGSAANPTFGFSPISTNTTQPSFLATAALQSNVTGDGTAYTVIFSAVSANNFDQGSNFDGTSTFTVPVGGAGVYLFSVDISYGDLGAAHVIGFVDIYINGVATYRGFNCNLGAIRNNANGAELPFSQIMKLADGDAVTIVTTIAGSTKTVDVLAGSNFSGCKLW